MNIDIHKTEHGFVAGALQDLAPGTGESISARLDYEENLEGRGYWSIQVTHYETADDLEGYLLFKFAERFDRLEGDMEMPPFAFDEIDARDSIEQALSEARVRLGYEARGTTLRLFQDVPLSCIPVHWNDNGAGKPVRR